MIFVYCRFVHYCTSFSVLKYFNKCCVNACVIVFFFMYRKAVRFFISWIFDSISIFYSKYSNYGSTPITFFFLEIIIRVVKSILHSSKNYTSIEKNISKNDYCKIYSTHGTHVSKFRFIIYRYVANNFFAAWSDL